MAFTFNGIGTTYYGNRDTGPDGSFVTTEWLVFIYLPILPIRSFRVLPTGQNTNAFVYNSQGYMAQRVPLCWRQVRNVYLGIAIAAAAMFAFIFGISWVINRSSQPQASLPSPPSGTAATPPRTRSTPDLKALSNDDLFFLLGVDASQPKPDVDKALKISESRRRFKVVELPPETPQQLGTVFENSGKTWRITRILSDGSVAADQVNAAPPN